MGYTTYFNGEITIEPPLNEHEVSFLRDFANTRRMIRTKGPLFVGGTGFCGQGHYDDVLNFNNANGEKPYFRDMTPEEEAHYEEGGQPGLWCHWVPADDGTTLAWDEGEKFYHADHWMKYIVQKLLAPEARAYIDAHIEEDERLKYFTCDHVCNGEIYADGEDADDLWKLAVENNRVTVTDGAITYDSAKAVEI